MIQPTKTHRILFALVLYSSCAIGAYGRSSSSLRSLTGQTETISFLAWMVLGLIAGFIGSKIVNRRGEASCSTSSWELSALLRWLAVPTLWSLWRKRAQPLQSLRGGYRLSGFPGSLSRPQTEKGLVV